jgi:ADP-heptose:LPS heptosyltransferase
VAALPVVAAIGAAYPATRIEVVTGPASAALFGGHRDVDRVHVLDAGGSRLRTISRVLRLARVLRHEPVGALLDLQRSGVSRLLTLAVRPRAFAAFDRFAPKHGLDRYLEAAERLGLEGLSPVLEPRIRPGPVAAADSLLARSGVDPGRPLVCLNPVGGWRTKQWPLERYAELGKRLAGETGARCLLLGAGEGVGRLRGLARALGEGAVDLSGETTPDVAMAVLARASLVVSDDSGLMHLAWTQGVPTVAIFGASRATWCRPTGERTDGFYSEDLPCGACMRPRCARGDLYCLERVSVDDVLARALPLLRADASAPPTA